MENRDIYSAGGKRSGGGTGAGNEAFHGKSRLRVLTVISAGTLLGFFIASSLNGRAG